MCAYCVQLVVLGHVILLADYKIVQLGQLSQQVCGQLVPEAGFMPPVPRVPLKTLLATWVSLSDMFDIQSGGYIK